MSRRKDLLEEVEELEEVARNLTEMGWSEDSIFQDTDDMTNEELEEYIEELQSFIEDQEVAIAEEFEL